MRLHERVIEARLVEEWVNSPFFPQIFLNSVGRIVLESSSILPTRL